MIKTTIVVLSALQVKIHSWKVTIPCFFYYIVLFYINIFMLFIGNVYFKYMYCKECGVQSCYTIPINYLLYLGLAA